MAAATPAADGTAAGTPADAKTVAAVTGTIRELFACSDAGDDRRYDALVTEVFIRTFLGAIPPE